MTVDGVSSKVHNSEHHTLYSAITKRQSLVTCHRPAHAQYMQRACAHTHMHPSPRWWNPLCNSWYAQPCA